MTGAGQELRFAGYAALFDRRDAGGDVIRKGAFARTLAESATPIPLFWQHRPEQRIGWVETIAEDSKGLRVVASIDKSDGGAAASLRQGKATGLSFGYRARGFVRDDAGRVLTDIQLLEVSLVTHPMQHRARVHMVQPSEERKFNQRHYQENGQFARAGEGVDYGGGAAGGTSMQLAKKPSSGSSRYPARIDLRPYPVRINLPVSRPAKAPEPDSLHPDKVRTIMPAAGKRADIYSRPLSRAMSTHGIHSPEQQAVFLAQVSVESAHLRHTAENLNYSAERIVKVWPSRFPNVESAKPYAHNPEALANRVYGERMGNSGIEGAGYRFRGRGLIQVTGRYGYRAIGYENNPEALELPEIVADSAARYWRANNLHLRTKRELTRREFDAISRYVNGGNHGINERWAAYQRALVVLRRKEPAK